MSAFKVSQLTQDQHGQAVADFVGKNENTTGNYDAHYQVELLVSAMASYSTPSGVGNVIPQEVKDALQPLLAETWQST